MGISDAIFKLLYQLCPQNEQTDILLPTISINIEISIFLCMIFVHF